MTWKAVLCWLDFYHWCSCVAPSGGGIFGRVLPHTMAEVRFLAMLSMPIPVNESPHSKLWGIYGANSHTVIV